MKDEIYSKPQKKIRKFTFNKEVTHVFDDMLERSIPHYRENLKYQVRLAQQFYQPGTHVYDLGCSHGNLTLSLYPHLKSSLGKIIAVDNSQPMIEAFHKKLKKLRSDSSIELICQDILDTKIKKASVVILNYILQFIAPPQRLDLLEKIYRGMNKGGILLLSEKMGPSSSLLGKLERAFHEEFKRNKGYSSLEISQKREALDKVLIPDSKNVHLRRLKKTGFKEVYIWFKWFNFSSFFCKK